VKTKYWLVDLESAEIIRELNGTLIHVEDCAAWMAHGWRIAHITPRDRRRKVTREMVSHVLHGDRSMCYATFN
jgi:hypothetical protein